MITIKISEGDCQLKISNDKINEGNFSGKMITSNLVLITCIFIYYEDDQNNILAEDSHGDISLLIITLALKTLQ